MKYYLIEISTGDSKITGKAIYEYDTLNDAVAMFHKKLGTAMSSDLYDIELVVVMDSYGNQFKCEFYKKPVVAENEITEAE